MSKRNTHRSLALAALLAGALALPGLAAADWDRGGNGGGRGDWHGERRHEHDGGYRGERRYGGEERHERHERHHHDHWGDRGYRGEREVVERPAYRSPQLPVPPGLSVFFNKSW